MNSKRGTKWDNKKEENGLERERDWRKGNVRRINLKRGFGFWIAEKR
jgi:hypothetical protein